ncbi:MAG: Rrf2 family transcriptional regulator [Candidatus Latescibacterota bacterium]|nr:MAG: Rrf2 family transcriptional regulator [Candidatus Latescibacterota bacterium]
MMKLTSQEEYGLRCILSLARRQAQEAALVRMGAAGGSSASAPLTIGQIAELEGFSTEYAGKLMGILTRAGLVESVRGRHGGYRLARPARAICVSEVLAALGDKLYRPTETCDRFSGDSSFCVHSNTCSIRSLWSGLQLLLDWVLSRTTLHDLVATNESNMAEWMRSQFEALTQLAAKAPAPAGDGINVTLVAPGARSVEPAES